MKYVIKLLVLNILFISCQKRSEKIEQEDLSTYEITNADLKNELTAFIKKIDELNKTNVSFQLNKEDSFLIEFGTIIIEDEPSDTLVFIYNAKPYDNSTCKGILYYMGKKVFFSSPFENLDGIIEIKKTFNECEKYCGGEFDLPPQRSWKFSKGKLLKLDE